MIAINKILVPVDFSDCSRVALDYAVYLANKLGASDIHVLHVLQLPAFSDEAKIQVEGEREQTLAEFGRSKAGGAMKEFLAEIEQGAEGEQAGYAVHGRLESGQPAQTVVELVDAEGYDLVIMGTHGEAEAAKLGSIATKVVRNASCPVLTIRGGESC